MLRDKRLPAVFFILFANFLGAAAIVPLLPLYAESPLEATPLQATLLISAFSAFQSFMTRFGDDSMQAI